VNPLKKEIIHKIDSGKYKNSYRICYDIKNRWGPIVSREQAEEFYSRFMNSGKTYEEFVREYDEQ